MELLRLKEEKKFKIVSKASRMKKLQSSEEEEEFSSLSSGSGENGEVENVRKGTRPRNINANITGKV